MMKFHFSHEKKKKDNIFEPLTERDLKFEIFQRYHTINHFNVLNANMRIFVRNLNSKIYNKRRLKTPNSF